MKKYLWLLIFPVLWSCQQKEDVEFRKVLNVRFEMVSKSPMLKADMVFYNPNQTRAKLKKIELDILVNDKKAGIINQTLNQQIEGKSEFTVPIEVTLSLKDLGLMDALVSLFGGKKYAVRMMGKIRISVHGFSFGVPVDHQEEIRLR